MKVTRINKIKNHRIFQDFTWPQELYSFARFNVIYGWNASGKTTLSSLFRCLQDRSPVTEGQIEFQIDESTIVSGSNIPAAVLPAVRVFNSDFIAKTINSINLHQVEPIYFLGADNIEKQEQVELLKDNLKSIRDEINRYKLDMRRAEESQNNFSIKSAKFIKDTLFRIQNYTNYDKRRYTEAIKKLKDNTVLPTVLSDEKKRQLRSQIELQAKDSIPFITLNDIPDLQSIYTKVDTLLQRSIVSRVLDELVIEHEVGIWVQDGLALHSGKYETDVCRFCGNELSIQRRLTLEAHFNESFSSLQKDLECAIQNMNSSKDTLSSLRLPDDSRFYSNFAEDARVATTNIKNLLEKKIQILNMLQQALREKKDAPFINIKLNESDFLTCPTFGMLDAAINEINAIIKKHEDMTSNLKDEILKASHFLEQDFLFESLQEFNNLEEAMKKYSDFLNEAEAREKLIQPQIDNLEREIIEHRRPAEELNKELIAYLGRDGLRFEVKETGYTLTRRGEPAKNLSEGERTAIAFLYFLKSLEDKSFDMKSGIIVIDDPVSSLDTNSLFSAFAYMKERTKDAGQLFIFTHNFGFFRQIKNWFHYLNKKKQPPARFFSIISEADEAQWSSKITKLDRLLEQYESEYHFLFKQVYELANSKSKTTELTPFYGVPNIARRLIETFLAYRYPNCNKDLFKCFEEITYDLGKKTRILRLLNTYSHSRAISDPEHDLSILAETKPVLLEILELMKELDAQHFAGMEELAKLDAENLSSSSPKLPVKTTPNQPAVVENV